jgi:hypothetical protein
MSSPNPPRYALRRCAIPFPPPNPRFIIVANVGDSTGLLLGFDDRSVLHHIAEWGHRATGAGAGAGGAGAAGGGGGGGGGGAGAAVDSGAVLSAAVAAGVAAPGGILAPGADSPLTGPLASLTPGVPLADVEVVRQEIAARSSTDPSTPMAVSARWGAMGHRVQWG